MRISEGSGPLYTEYVFLLLLKEQFGVTVLCFPRADNSRNLFARNFPRPISEKHIAVYFGVN